MDVRTGFDPLSNPVGRDPDVGPYSPNRRAGNMATEARMAGVTSGGNPEAMREAMVQNYVAQGIPYPEAVRIASFYFQGPPADAPAPGRAPAEFKSTPDPRIGDYRRAPGPRLPNGLPTPQGEPIVDEDDQRDYEVREENPDTPGEYLPSQRDEDMRLRGMVPRYNADGSVGYGVEYSEDPSIIGAPGRPGVRIDLLEKGWTSRGVKGPTGPVTVMVPGEEAKARYALQDRQRSALRLAEQSGIPAAKALELAQTEDGMNSLRLGARAARADEANARRDLWRKQAMLAGGQPTGGRGGSKAIVNALEELDPEERKRSLQYMLPGGQLVASVDAQNMQNAARLMTAETLAGMDPLAREAAREKLRQARRADPVAAGKEDLQSGNWQSPEAEAEVDRLAESMDTTTGGFSDEDENRLVDYLIRNYGMGEAEARQAARKAADGRRWIGARGPIAPPSPAPGSAGSAPGSATPTPTPASSATRPLVPGQRRGR